MSLCLSPEVTQSQVQGAAPEWGKAKEYIKKLRYNLYSRWLHIAFEFTKFILIIYLFLDEQGL